MCQCPKTRLLLGIHFTKVQKFYMRFLFFYPTSNNGKKSFTKIGQVTCPFDVKFLGITCAWFIEES